MLNLKSGRLSHRVQIVTTKPGVQDPETGFIGEPTKSVKTVWAAFEPLSGREFVAAQAVQSQVTARVVIRPTPLDTKATLIHRGIEYDINAVLPDPDSGNKYYTLLVSRHE